MEINKSMPLSYRGDVGLRAAAIQGLIHDGI